MPRIQKDYLILGSVILSFFAIKFANIYPKISDENIWFYASYLMGQGIMPYRDFFQSHLPGHLLLLLPVIKIFGFNFTALKMVSILLTCGSGYLVYRLWTRFLGSPGMGTLVSLFFLFSFTVLTTTDHDSAVHEATFFTLLTWYLLVRKSTVYGLQSTAHTEKAVVSSQLAVVNVVLAGLAFFFGLMVRIYILPAIAALVIWFLFKRKFREMFIFLSVGIVPYLATNFALYKIFGQNFIDQAWKYHFLKTTGIEKTKIFSYFATNEWLLLLLFVSALVVIFMRLMQDKEVDLPPVVGQAFLVLFAQFSFYLLFADIYFLYLVMLIAPLAIISGWGLMQILKDTRLDIEKVTLSVAIVFIIFNTWNYFSNHAETSRITELKNIVADVKALGTDGSTIWGTFAVVPHVAAGTGYPIKDNIVDTNAKRALTGLYSKEKATKDAIESTFFIQLGLVGRSPKQNDIAGAFSTQEEILKLDPDYVSQVKIQDSCKLIKTYPVPKDYDNNTIFLWRCSAK